MRWSDNILFGQLIRKFFRKRDILQKKSDWTKSFSDNDRPTAGEDYITQGVQGSPM